MKYRPWGEVNWALSLSSPKRWNFVGALGTEERSLCSWHLFRSLQILESERILQINDVDSEKYRVQSQAALTARYDEFNQGGGDEAIVSVMDLMAELFQIQRVIQSILNMGDSVVLDITSMPKRFFFPILRSLTLNDAVQNLIMTYSSPATYANGALYEDIDGWRNLPGFGGIGTGPESLIVSIGFLVESLKGYFSNMPDHGQVKLLIPFPAPLAVLKRTWESVSNIEREKGNNLFDKYRVETRDMSAAFDQIDSLANNAQYPPAFAPFGPKPTSAAMCLYASQKDSAVYYPQPTVYHPEYSLGIRNNDPASAVSAYWVKHEGENLYSL